MYEPILQSSPQLSDTVVFWITAFGGLIALLLPRIA
jgi:hypothetical protein